MLTKFVMHTDEGAFLFQGRLIYGFENLLKSHFDSSRRLARKAFSVADAPVDMAVSGASNLCSVILKELRIDSKFEQFGDFLAMSFTPNAINMSLTWAVPKDMELRFAADCVSTGHAVRPFQMGECYLFAKKIGQAGFYKLPIPNNYADGRICMGNQVAGRIFGNTVQDCFKAALESFNSTTWNNDLNERPQANRAMFKWKPDRTQVPVQSDWETLCHKTSRVEMEELCPG